jgi:D-hydroxyproline dehydrogenase subunit gamma
MSSTVQLTINGQAIQVPRGTTVAVALLLAGTPSRKSVTEEARAPLCGMGICFECRTTIDGKPHQRSCQILCEDFMDVRTQ